MLVFVYVDMVQVTVEEHVFFCVNDMSDVVLLGSIR